MIALPGCVIWASFYQSRTGFCPTHAYHQLQNFCVIQFSKFYFRKSFGRIYMWVCRLLFDQVHVFALLQLDTTNILICRSTFEVQKLRLESFPWWSRHHFRAVKKGFVGWDYFKLHVCLVCLFIQACWAHRQALLWAAASQAQGRLTPKSRLSIGCMSLDRHGSGGAVSAQYGAALGSPKSVHFQCRTPIPRLSWVVSGCKTASAAALRGLNPLLAIQPGGQPPTLGSRCHNDQVRGSGPIFHGHERVWGAARALTQH